MEQDLKRQSPVELILYALRLRDFCRDQQQRTYDESGFQMCGDCLFLIPASPQNPQPICECNIPAQWGIPPDMDGASKIRGILDSIPELQPISSAQKNIDLSPTKNNTIIYEEGVILNDDEAVDINGVSGEHSAISIDNGDAVEENDTVLSESLAEDQGDGGEERDSSST